MNLIRLRLPRVDYLPRLLVDASRSNKMVAPCWRLNAIQRFHHSRRFLSNQTNIVKSSTSNMSPKEPKLSTLNQPSNILQEKAHNAARLHAELNALLDAQAERQTKELSKPFGSFIKNFVKTNRKELVNIFAAFMCVLLAWQITTMRKGARKLADITEEKDKIIKEMRFILRQLGNTTDSAFAEKIVERFIQEMKRHGGSLEEEPSSLSSQEKRSGFYNGILSLFQGSNHIMKEDEEKRIRTLLGSILKQELDTVIGTAAMSNDEVAEKKMSELQREMGIASLQRQSGGGESDLVHILDSINRDVDVSSDPGNTVKKSKGFI